MNAIGSPTAFSTLAADAPAATLSRRVTSTSGGPRVALRPAGGRGLRRPVDARRQPRQVAPGPHELVLRDVRPQARVRPSTRPSRQHTAICSTPITTPSASGSRGRSAGCSRGRRSPRSTATARIVDDGMLRRSSGTSTRLGSGRLAATIVLGLHHEQQHQELILTDLKHAFGRNPLRPVYREHEPCPAADGPAPIGWLDVPAGLRRIGHDGDGFAFDNESPRHRGLRRGVPAGRPARDQRRIPRLHGGRRLRAARALALRRLGRPPSRTAGRPRSTGSGSARRLADHDAGGRARPATRPSRSATSATTRPTPSPAGPVRGSRPRPSGRSRAEGRAGRGQLPRERAVPPRAARSARCDGRTPFAALRRRLGVDPQPLLALSRLSVPPPGARASTTASSCATRWSCAAALRHAPLAHPAAPTATSSPPTPAGSSRGSGWPWTSECVGPRGQISGVSSARARARPHRGRTRRRLGGGSLGRAQAASCHPAAGAAIQDARQADAQQNQRPGSGTATATKL